MQMMSRIPLDFSESKKFLNVRDNLLLTTPINLLPVAPHARPTSTSHVLPANHTHLNIRRHFVQPFAALYVLILASLEPMLAKESERVYDLSARLLGQRDQTMAEDTAEAEM